MTRTLRKSDRNRMLFGVCGGVAEFFNIDVTLVRIVWALLAVVRGFGLVVYLIAAIVMPSAGFDGDEDAERLKSANADDPGDFSGTPPHSDEEFDAFFKK